MVPHKKLDLILLLQKDQKVQGETLVYLGHQESKGKEEMME